MLPIHGGPESKKNARNSEFYTSYCRMSKGSKTETILKIEQLLQFLEVLKVWLFVVDFQYFAVTRRLVTFDRPNIRTNSLRF